MDETKDLPSPEPADDVDDASGGDGVEDTPDGGDDEPAADTPEAEARYERALELLSSTDPAAYHRSISSLLRSGADTLLKPMPYDETKPYHDPACVVVEPQQQGLDTMRLYSRFAYRDFDKVLAEPFNDPRFDHLLTSIHHLTVNEGKNIAVVTNHGELHDIALVLSALVLALCDENRTFGVLGERTSLEEVSERSNLLLSRMVAMTEVFNIPTTEVLQVMCRTFYSVPQTASRRRSKVDPELARANNVVMRRQLEMQLEKGGQILAMAASGSQDIRVAAGVARFLRHAWRGRRGEDRNADAPSLHLQPLYNGTMNLMMTCDYVLPVAISLKPEHPACELGGLTKVRSTDDCHAVMHWIAETHERATGVVTEYHPREDDLLTQIRDALRGEGRSGEHRGENRSDRGEQRSGEGR